MTCKPDCPGHYSFPPVLRKDGQPDGRYIHKRRVVVVPMPPHKIKERGT